VCTSRPLRPLLPSFFVALTAFRCARCAPGTARWRRLSRSRCGTGRRGSMRGQSSVLSGAAPYQTWQGSCCLPARGSESFPRCTARLQSECGVRAGERLLISIRLAELKWPRAHRYRLGFSLLSQPPSLHWACRQACKRLSRSRRKIVAVCVGARDLLWRLVYHDVLVVVVVWDAQFLPSCDMYFR
jgi:hypothetical protein